MTRLQTSDDPPCVGEVLRGHDPLIKGVHQHVLQLRFVRRGHDDGLFALHGRNGQCTISDGSGWFSLAFFTRILDFPVPLFVRVHINSYLTRSGR